MSSSQNVPPPPFSRFLRNRDPVRIYDPGNWVFRLDFAGLAGWFQVFPVVTLTCFPGYLEKIDQSLTPLISLSGRFNGSILLSTKLRYFGLVEV